MSNVNVKDLAVFESANLLKAFLEDGRIRGKTIDSMIGYVEDLDKMKNIKMNLEDAIDKPYFKKRKLLKMEIEKLVSLIRNSAGNRDSIKALKKAIHKLRIKLSFPVEYPLYTLALINNVEYCIDDLVSEFAYIQNFIQSGALISIIESVGLVKLRTMLPEFDYKQTENYYNQKKTEEEKEVEVRN